MSSFDMPIASDVNVLLRADAERRWLHLKVIPILHQLETREQLPDDQVDAALAYLESTWDEALMRARATDAAHSDLHLRGDEHDVLRGSAERYHAAVCVLRRTLAERVTPLMEPEGEREGELSLRDAAAARPSGGIAPQAA